MPDRGTCSGSLFVQEVRQKMISFLVAVKRTVWYDQNRHDEAVNLEIYSGMEKLETLHALGSLTARMPAMTIGITDLTMVSGRRTIVAEIPMLDFAIP